MPDAAIDIAAYTQGEAFQCEKRSLFARTWLPFCAGAQVANAGDFVSHSFGGWPLFVVRGKDAVLRAFHNTCRHQQMPVVEKPSGRCDMLRCRYHGWTYDLAGALAVAPPMVAPPDPKSVRLAVVELAEQSPFVFVRLESAREAPPPIDTQGLRFATAVTTDAACNWKTYIETLIGASDWQLLWPLVMIRRFDALTVVRQVVPRSFTRTRIVDHVFADGPIDEALQGRIAAAAAADKTRAEAAQEQLAAGSPSAASPAVHEFRARIAAACAEAAAP